MLFTSSFTSCTGQVKHSKVQVHPLTLCQLVLLPMQRWRWPVLEMFQIPAVPCSMPSNPKRCMSLTAFYFLKNSGDAVLQHFDTFRTRLWPTKMPTRMVFSHSKLCNLVRGRKVGCSSLIAKKRGVSVRAANKLWKPRIDRLLQQVASLVSIHINMIWETTCDPAMSIEPFAEQVQRQLPRAPPDKKGKDAMLLGGVSHWLGFHDFWICSPFLIRWSDQDT